MYSTPRSKTQIAFKSAKTKKPQLFTSLEQWYYSSKYPAITMGNATGCLRSEHLCQGREAPIVIDVKTLIPNIGDVI